MKKKTSITDIANQLGVSITLVSMVLNGKAKQYRIGDDICKLVLQKAKELNYHPNQMARGLRTGKTNTIGLIIADIANPFFAKLGREIEVEASKHGYRIVFCSCDEDPKKFKEQLAMLRQSQVDGFIISPPISSESDISSLETGHVPYVLIDRYFPEIDSNYIVVDNFNASYQATNYLIKKGRKRIAIITLNVKLKTMQERTEGYRSALSDSGINPDESLVKVLPFSHENVDMEKAIKQLMQAKNNELVDAILFSSSKIGIMGIECMTNLGIRIPEDVAIISFDDPDAFRICHPPVTAIAQPLKEIGKRSIDVLLDQIGNKTLGKKQQIVLNTEFILRKSSG